MKAEEEEARRQRELEEAPLREAERIAKEAERLAKEEADEKATADLRRMLQERIDRKKAKATAA